MKRNKARKSKNTPSLPNTSIEVNKGKEGVKESVTEGDSIGSDPVKLASALLPKNLNELKALCPPNLTGLERSQWIQVNRVKFKI